MSNSSLSYCFRRPAAQAFSSHVSSPIDLTLLVCSGYSKLYLGGPPAAFAELPANPDFIDYLKKKHIMSRQSKKCGCRFPQRLYPDNVTDEVDDGV